MLNPDGEKNLPRRQSISESAKWSGAGSMGKKVKAGAVSIAHGRVTSVGTKKALAGLIPAPPVPLLAGLARTQATASRSEPGAFWHHLVPHDLVSV